MATETERLEHIEEIVDRFLSSVGEVYAGAGDDAKKLRELRGGTSATPASSAPAVTDPNDR